VKDQRLLQNLQFQPIKSLQNRLRHGSIKLGCVDSTMKTPS